MGLCGSTDNDTGPSDGVPVYVNVYDLQGRKVEGKAGASSVNGIMGLGVYHSGVEVFNIEYSFGGDPSGGAPEEQSGVFSVTPKTALPSAQFYKQHKIGYLPPEVKPHMIYALVNRLKPQWRTRSYHLVKKNCNHFSEAFVAALDEEFITGPARRRLEEEREAARTGASAPLNTKTKAPTRVLFLPAYVNRAARFGSVVAPGSVIRALERRSGAPPASEAPPPSAGPSPSSSGKYQSGPAPTSAASQPPQDDARRQHPLPKTREELENMNNRELKTAMYIHGVDWQGCVEKSDFVDAVLRHHAANP